MAAVNITIPGINQKITRNTQVAAQEDVWTVTGLSNNSLMVLYVRPTVDTFYHSASGQAATDGYIIRAGMCHPVIVATTTVFYLRPVSTAGTIDCTIVPAGVALNTTPTLGTDATGSLLQGTSARPTYTINTLTSAPAVANYTILNIEAGATKIPRIRRIIISNPGFGTAAAALTFEVVRTTAASSVGTAVTPSIHDTSVPDAAYGGTARKDGATITAGTQITTFEIFQPATLAGSYVPMVIELYGQISKPYVIPTGVTNGIALRCINGNAGATGFCASMEFTEEAV